MLYQELVDAVSAYCENVFQKTDIDTFIRQAEQRIFNVAQPANQRKNVTGSLTAGSPGAAGTSTLMTGGGPEASSSDDGGDVAAGGFDGFLAIEVAKRSLLCGGTLN